MPGTGFLFLSLASVVVGTLLFLYPSGIHRFSGLLNRTMATLDESLIRNRYVLGVLTFVAGYAFFKLALLIPLLRN